MEKAGFICVIKSAKASCEEVANRCKTSAGSF
jgi:hypothetical protein